MYDWERQGTLYNSEKQYFKERHASEAQAKLTRRGGFYEAVILLKQSCNLNIIVLGSPGLLSIGLIAVCVLC